MFQWDQKGWIKESNLDMQKMVEVRTRGKFQETVSKTNTLPYQSVFKNGAPLT